MVCIEKCYFLRYTNNSVDIFYNLNFNPPASHFKVQPSARKKFWPSNQAGEKEGGWGEEFRHARAVARHFRRLGIKTSKQNNFQFLLRKIWRAGVKKLKENCFALLAEVRRAETLRRGFKSFERLSLEKGSSFVQQLRQKSDFMALLR